ncbi:hypothetical protein N7478_001730 [Penicillium angulare]|uniref:uncharacterized protein n=1 Tax=Penicillium angulare TaxID=116970 RepID=UPI00253FAC77|nr:uncharacterized protein N7478_001730 [Penicillium angulare]KAJ5288700.1 hypothetical protein N7478_001730 [Penicillium angulare]
MDDDYVAQVLAKEARESSQKYSSNGLSAFMPSKPTSNAPKPNTRFLRHLIKETDSHNTALKRKEEKEARERMQDLIERLHAVPKVRAWPARTNIDLMEGGIQVDLHLQKETGHDVIGTGTRKIEIERETADMTAQSDEESDHILDLEVALHAEKENETEIAPPNPASRESERRSRRDEHTSSRQHRLTPPKSDEPRESKSSSTTTTQRRDVSEDSDPLEELVGPLHPSTANSEAPIRSRGRGAYRSNTSNIDAHFASDYDPTLDIQPDEVEGNNTKQPSRRHVTGLMTGEDDWEMALEAMRDRTKWKQKGEERLRAAGINEGAIDRWKKEPAFTGLDGERRPEDVRWSKSGEGREWDRGKFVDDEGHIDVRAAWPKSN